MSTAKTTTRPQQIEILEFGFRQVVDLSWRCSQSQRAVVSRDDYVINNKLQLSVSVRRTCVIGGGTRALLFTFITYIQYTSQGSRRHITSHDLFRDPVPTHIPHHLPA